MEEKRFSQIMQEEIEKPVPSAEGILSLQERLRAFAANIRRKFGWRPPKERFIPIVDFKQQEEDALNEVIATMMHRYRQKLMSSHVTERAAYAVLNQVRGWVRRRYTELSREQYASNEDIENFAPAVFHVSAENKLEDFERLHKLGVIDLVEFYFLFAAYHRETTVHAAKLIDMPEGTARKLLKRARERVQTYLDGLDDTSTALPAPRSVSSESGLDPQRNMDMDKLMSAFRHILGRAV